MPCGFRHLMSRLIDFARIGTFDSSFPDPCSMWTSFLRSDSWRVVDDDYGQTVGKLQAESMMSTAASLFPQ
jgi:hypothetical protein